MCFAKNGFGVANPERVRRVEIEEKERKKKEKERKKEGGNILETPNHMGDL